MRKPRYYEWDFVANEVVKWERHGECKKCGACCKSKVQFGFQKPFQTTKAGGHTTDEIGIWTEVDMGRWRHFFKMQAIQLDGPGCPTLTDDNLCDGHEDDERAWICKKWPFSPRCVAAFPDCGYSFKEAERWRMDEIEGQRVCGEREDD